MKYSVKVIFTYSVECDGGTFYEESIFLVDAESFDEAYAKVENHIKDFDTVYVNPEGRKVKTENVDILNCFLCFDKENGVQEVYSSISKNNTSADRGEFYKAITSICESDDLTPLRYGEFNKSIDND